MGDDQLIDQMLAHPILINRPIVVSPLGVRLCRPSDMVIELLPQRPAGEICKEDGTTLLADTPIAGSDPDLALALHEAGLPTDDLTEPGRRFFAYATVSGERVGFGGFEHMGRDVLVRSWWFCHKHAIAAPAAACSHCCCAAPSMKADAKPGC